MESAMEFELQTLDQRLGKFEGVQQQHDQRLADIERRLSTIEVLIRDVRAEGHREREALRTELTSQIHETHTELIGQIESVRTELTSKIESYREEIAGVRGELNGRIDQLSNKIDGLYKWIIGILIAVGISVIASLLKGIF
jgi:predicted  nucleic acid-binding Zn-ribbon protein